MKKILKRTPEEEEMVRIAKESAIVTLICIVIAAVLIAAMVADVKEAVYGL